MEISKNKLPNIKKAKKRNIKKKIITFCYDKKFNNLGKNKKYFIRTYGCQSNIRDSEIISGILKQLSYVPTTNIENANLVILNTCAIRENAELKVFSEIGLLKKLKEKNDVKFGICGCMAQEEGVVEKIIKKIPHVDFIFGTNDINEIPRILYDLYNTKKRVISVSSNLNYIYENLPSIRDNKIKAFVNIMYGCDKFCSYCIVPYTRGPLRSRKSEDILQEVNELIKKGYKEVTLIGQNVNSYGLDFKKNYYFKNLLEDVAKTNIERVRFTTSNP
jgi:tRNA-2-methylthio-N6-dimethylallyladenosine synthase